MRRQNTHKTRIIKLGNRFFCGFGKDQRVKTAWSVAGAKCFLMCQNDKINEVIEVLVQKKKQFEIQTLAIESNEPEFFAPIHEDVVDFDLDLPF